MIKKEELLQYLAAIFFSLVLVGICYAVETAVSGEGGLSALNVALAAGTLFLLGIVLLLGPLSRLFSVFDWAFKFRKELGVLSFFTGLLHVYLVMFPLARNGPWGLYVSRPWSAYPGLEALAILFVLFVISNNLSMRMLGSKLWWQLQYWGVRVTFVLIAIHTFVLKFKTITTWLVPGSSDVPVDIHFPPLVIWEVEFVLLVLLIRVSELFGIRWARIIAMVSTLFVACVIVWITWLR